MFTNICVKFQKYFKKIKKNFQKMSKKYLKKASLKILLDKKSL